MVLSTGALALSNVLHARDPVSVARNTREGPLPHIPGSGCDGWIQIKK